MDQLLTKIARNCPDYNPITAAQIYSLPHHLQHLTEVTCQSCIYWEESSCSTFQSYQESQDNQ